MLEGLRPLSRLESILTADVGAVPIPGFLFVQPATVGIKTIPADFDRAPHIPSARLLSQG